MNLEKINDTYYCGFEGNPEITFKYTYELESHLFKMWIGYFDTILMNMLNYESLENEFLEVYNLHEGWYDESPWEIKNISEVIELFNNFDVNKIPGSVKEQSGNIISKLSDLIEELVNYLKKASESKEKIYIIYD